MVRAMTHHVAYPMAHPMAHANFAILSTLKEKNIVTRPGNKHLSPVKGRGMAAMFFSRVGPRSFWQRYALFRLVRCFEFEILKVSMVNKKDKPNMTPIGRDL